jgi:hypothetical protein
VRKKKIVFVLYVGIKIKTKDSHNDADYMSTYDPPGLSSSIFGHSEDDKSGSSQRSNNCGISKYIFKIKNNCQSNSSQQTLEYVIGKIFLQFSIKYLHIIYLFILLSWKLPCISNYW